MKHSIEQVPGGLRIMAEVPPEKRKGLLDELGKCAAGTCSCPTAQYEKLSAIDVSADAHGVSVELKLKPGQQIDTTAIEGCLAHAARISGV